VKPEVLKRALRFSVLDGCAYAFMAGGAESYLTAFAVHLGVPPFKVGLLTAVPQLVGSGAQLGTPAGVRLVQGLKRWVVGLASLQALVLAAVVLVPRFGGDAFLPLLLLLTSYWTLVIAIGPAWTHWMALLVPASFRSAYFARRNRWVHICMFAGLAGAGIVLQRSAGADITAAGFTAIILFGAAMRVISVVFLSLQAGPPSRELKRAESFATFLRKLRQRREFRLLPFLWAMNFAVAIGAPYFVPYMLSDLGLSYWMFMVINGTAFLTKSLTMSLWARLARRLGARRSFALAALLISPGPALWAISGAPLYLMSLQVLAGFAWAGFELCQLLLFYELVEEERLSDAFSYHSLVNGFVMLAGTAIGGWFLAHPVVLDGYHQIFILSTLVRIFPIITIFPTLRGLAIRHVKPLLPEIRVAGLGPEIGSRILPLWFRRGRKRRPLARQGRRQRPEDTPDT
jgi:predicted MFS family arabinose efflux permease